MSFYTQSEDIELYVNHNVETGEKPKVLFMFDTSGSMLFRLSDGRACYKSLSDNINSFIECSTSPPVGESTCFAKDIYNGNETIHAVTCEKSRLSVAKEAVDRVLTENQDNIEFGLIRFRGGEGGYILSKIGTSAATINTQVQAIIAGGATPLAETLYESYRYLAGGAVDQASSASDRDKSAESGSNYISPFKIEIVDGQAVLRCDNSVNIIIITDGDPTADDERNQNIIDLYPIVVGDDEGIYKAKIYEGSYLPALAKYMKSNTTQNDPLNIDLYETTNTVQDTATTYTIGFGKGLTPTGKLILNETAKKGGGVFFEAETSFELAEALKVSIDKINESNTSFTAPSVASNSSDRTQSNNSIYYAMFYPATGARWQGNLKKLKLINETLVDSTTPTALAAIDPVTGNIDNQARTFWLPDTANADGNIVKQGGVNLMLSTETSRLIYTDVGNIATGHQMAKFNFANAKRGAGGSLSALANYMKVPIGSSNSVTKQSIKDLILWSKGKDIDDEDNNPETTLRKDIMGDPIHSKPIVLDYGNEDVRILIGTNAGFIHMFKDLNDTVSESWAFIPYELFDNLQNLRINEPDADEKLYGMDNTAAVYFDDKDGNGIVDDTDTVWAFFSMRRGGKSYYAIDITNPDSPRLMWKLSSGDENFSHLGQTWSKPYIGFVNATGFDEDPVLIFGGGFDTNKDNKIRSNDTYGKSVYIIKAEDKSLVWSASPGNHSIPGEISVLDSDYDGYIDRLYAADTGGDVWRFDLKGTEPNSSTEPWKGFKLAELGAATGANDRKFFYKPVVARTYFSKVKKTTVIDESGTSIIYNRKVTPFEAVLIGSGNRVSPVTSVSTTNQLYMIRDENTITQYFDTAPTTITASDLNSIDSDPFGSVLNDVDAFRNQEALHSGFKGWKYNLSVTEKSLATANVVGGVAYFSTFTPKAETTVGQCEIGEGSGSVYAFHLNYGTKVYANLKLDYGEGIPDTPQLFFDKDSDDKSQFLLIGVGKADSSSGVIEAKSVLENIVPVDTDNDGNINLFTTNKLGLKTIRTYIYREEAISSN
ncbi:PilC/PilY family type IV pilus protein [Pseudoalteromonas sp. NBT06-2]|uniref:PilC/PilY family type IV pilus protein n=1 Tax=Pseudoalteromonas sp. NBT06-2 TaxID=2025950 RepID=UPI0020750479|nr:PilC/PilY family type IV pilus protein [Pseudoalteromonas sp. NBT06-2]